VKLSDNVLIAIVSIVPTTVASIVTLLVTLVTRRNVKTLDETMKKESATTRDFVRACHDHPDDLPTPPSTATHRQRR
jgi:hypothetical protein